MNDNMFGFLFFCKNGYTNPKVEYNHIHIFLFLSRDALFSLVRVPLGELFRVWLREFQHLVTLAESSAGTYAPEWVDDSYSLRALEL